MDVDITVPRMLADLVGTERVIPVPATDVGGALRALTERHPELRVHLFDETGDLRRNVMCFHNDGPAVFDAPLQPGDRITVLQAVSGG